MRAQGELDAVDQKQEFGAQLLKASTDAAEFKAQFDKVGEHGHGHPAVYAADLHCACV